MEALLRQDQGFDTVALLLNEQATKLNIERALDTAHQRLRRDASGRWQLQQHLPPSTSVRTAPGSVDNERAGEGRLHSVPTTRNGDDSEPPRGQSVHWQHLVHNIEEAGRFILFFAGHGIKVGLEYETTSDAERT